ncbi:MAG: hypothetical protein JOZ69_17930 [Myxococcales bacterium]|nr:hypothetical protein [Myxococcales bacterium]
MSQHPSSSRSVPRTCLAARAFVAAAVALGAPASAFAAGPAPALTDRDDVHACELLDDGELAVGTGGGLVVTHGRGPATVLTALDGLPETRVLSLARAGDRLWVGTENGLALVSLGPAPSVSATVPLPEGPVRALLVTERALYAGTWGSGVFQVPPGVTTAQPVESDSPGTLVTALAVHEGALHVAFSDGPPARLEGDTLRPLAPEPGHGEALASVSSAEGPALLLGDLEGLYRLARGGSGPGSVAPALLSPVDVRSIASSGSTVLVGTFGAGLLSGPAGGALRSDPEIPSFVRAVTARSGFRCVATTEGLFVDAGAGVGWERRSFGALPSNDVTALAALGQRVAVGTFDGGAAVVEGSTTRRLDGISPAETVNTLAWEGDDARARLWVATAHGLVRISPGGRTRRFGVEDGLPAAMVRAVLVTGDGRVIAGTDGGPAALVDGRRAVPLFPSRKGGGGRPLASPMRSTWALAKTPDGTLWIGTNAGLYFERGGRLRRASVAGGDLPDDWITALAVEGTDILAGTYAGGVTRLHLEGDDLRTTHLGGGNINPGGLAIVGDVIFAATMEGLLTRRSGDDAAPWQWRPEASPGRDVTSVAAVGDALWVASRRGIARGIRLETPGR